MKEEINIDELINRSMETQNKQPVDAKVDADVSSERFRWSAKNNYGRICRAYHSNTRIAYTMLELIGKRTGDEHFLEVLRTNDSRQDGRGWSFTLPTKCKKETLDLLKEWTTIWENRVETTQSRGWEMLKCASTLERFEKILDDPTAYTDRDDDPWLW